MIHITALLAILYNGDRHIVVSDNIKRKSLNVYPIYKFGEFDTERDFTIELRYDDIRKLRPIFLKDRKNISNMILTAGVEKEPIASGSICDFFEGKEELLSCVKQLKDSLCRTGYRRVFDAVFNKNIIIAKTKNDSSDYEGFLSVSENDVLVIYVPMLDAVYIFTKKIIGHTLMFTDVTFKVLVPSATKTMRTTLSINDDTISVSFQHVDENTHSIEIFKLDKHTGKWNS